MKLYAIILLHKDHQSSKARSLASALDLSSFSYFTRKNAGEFMQFTSRLIAERSAIPSRNSLKENEYFVHCYIRPDGLVGCCITDEEYQARVSFTLLNKVLADFSDKFSEFQWKSPAGGEGELSWPALHEFLVRWQNPREADSLTRVQDEVEETKAVLHNTMQSVLERGEKLDDLIAKSESLSDQSKMFYTQARKMNKCCNYV